MTADDETFWEARPELATIRDYAQARRVGAWAVLGGVLARVVASTVPEVALPPLVGSAGSLNLFCGIVATPGGGKGGSQRVAQEMLRTPGAFETVSLGSGEGVAAAYAHREPERDENGKPTGDTTLVMHTDRVLFDVAEVDTMTSLSKRTGSTLLAVLRSAWSGEALGFQNATADRRLPVAGHSYRAALTVGIQPGRAGALLDDSDGGTPQRFLWLPAIDPVMPDRRPNEPAPIDWAPPLLGDFAATGTPLRVMEVYSGARAEIDADRLARVRGNGHALDAHAMYTRLKVAAALALLDRSTSIGPDDWALAGMVMAVSDRTRAEVQHDLAKSAERVATARAEARANIVNKIEESTLSRAKARILDKLTTTWESAAPLRRNLAKSLRADFDDALAALKAEGLIEVADIDGQGQEGRHIRLRGGSVPPLPPQQTSGVAGVAARHPSTTLERVEAQP